MNSTIEFFTARSGYPSARIRFDDRTVHVHSTIHPEREFEYFKKLRLWGDVVVCAGTGLGYHLAGAIRGISPGTVLVLIEYHDECLRRLMQGLLKTVSNTIIAVSGTDSSGMRERLHSVFAAKAGRSIQVVRHPPSYHAHKDFYDERLSVVYACRGVKPEKRTHPRCLLLYGGFFLHEELRAALKRGTGEDPLLFRYEECASGQEYASCIQKLFETMRPDGVVSVNMKGFDGNGILSEIAYRSSIPAVVWFVDDPHPILLNQRQFVLPHMKAVCWEKNYLPFLRKCGFGHVDYLPLATDPSIFSPNESRSHTTRLGFVGTSMGGSFLETIRGRFLWDGQLENIAERASDILVAKSRGNCRDAVCRACADAGAGLPFTDDRNMTWLCSYVIHYASMKKRRRIVGELMPLGIETFGDPDGWRQVLGPDVRTHADIDYRHNLCDTYRRIEVNVNITSRQMTSAVNQRVFDIPMAGGFVVSDRQDDLGLLFELGREAVCYENPDDAGAVIRYFLDNPEARAPVVRAAQTRIRGEHTYDHRVRKILELFK